MLVLFELILTTLLELTISEITVPPPCVFVPLELIVLFKMLLKTSRVSPIIVSPFAVKTFAAMAVGGFVKLLVSISSNEDVMLTPNLLAMLNKLVTLICILLTINAFDIVAIGIIYCELCFLVPFFMFLLLFKIAALTEVLLELVLSTIV